MSKAHHPRRGSHSFWPRKRAKKPLPRIRHWPQSKLDKPKIQGFGGYKVGMTHGFMVDYRKGSTTSGQEVVTPITIVETPPMKVIAIRVYCDSEWGLKPATEIWHGELDKRLEKRIVLGKNDIVHDPKVLDSMDVDDVRLLVHTNPVMVKGIPKKKPEIMELRVDGGSMKDRIAYAVGLLGKSIDVTNFTDEGKMVDLVGITKGKGFQGHVKRFGVKLLTHKNSKHRRMIGTLGPWHPSYVLHTVPQAGQVGYHQRTEYNKRILKISENPDEINSSGGFKHYGKVTNQYVLIHGSIPGPTKRFIRFRDPLRFRGADVGQVKFSHISTQSKQGA